MGGGRRSSFPQESEREECDPAKASDNRETLKQAGWRVRDHAIRIEGSRYGGGNIEDHDEDTCDDGVQRPAAPRGITRKAPRQDKIGSGQRAESDKTREVVQLSMKDGSVRRAWWIPQARVSREETSGNEGESEGAKQERSPGGPMASLKDASKSEGKAKHEEATDTKGEDLHPPLTTEAERTDEIVPGTVAGTRGSFDEEDDDEHERADGTASDEDSDRERSVHDF